MSMALLPVYRFIFIGTVILLETHGLAEVKVEQVGQESFFRYVNCT
jgi:hypothetical protein